MNGATSSVIAALCASLLGPADGLTREEVMPPSVAEAPPHPSEWRRIALSKALNAAAAVDDPYRRAETFASIARVQVLIDDESAADRTVHQALTAAEQVAEPAFRGWVLHDVVLAQIAANDLYGARQTAARIEAERPQGAAFAAIADVQLRSGDIAAALRTAEKIRDPSAAGEVLRQVAAVQAAREELGAAREALRGIHDAFYRALATGDIAVAEVELGNIEGANALAARARKADRGQVYGRIAIARAAKADVPGAQETLKKIDDPMTRALVQGRIAASRAARGDATGARQLFAMAYEALDGVTKQEQRKIVTRSQVARLQAASGDPVAAKESLRHARLEADRLQPGEQRDEALEYIARGQVRAADAPGALETASQIGDRIARALLVRDVVTLQAGIVDASALAGFDDPLIQTAAQFGVLGVQITKPGQQISLDTIDAAARAVRSIGEVRLKPAAFSALAAARARTGDVKGSWSMFQEALAAAESIPRVDQRAAAYVQIVDALNDRLLFLGQPVRSDDEHAPMPQLRMPPR